MKTLTFAIALVLTLGTTALSFAGNNPALTYPTGGFSKVGAIVSNPGKVGALAYKYPSGIVVASAGNDICPVMKHRITSKHNATIALSNGKYMSVCCSPCKNNVEKDLGKFQTFMY